jgi:acylphosphatase
MVARRCIVSGRVQGVFYRKSAQQRARELGVAGHARNRVDGSVEVLAVGEAAAVEAFVAWLWQGSSTSRVTGVEVLELDLSAIQLPVGFFTG